MHIYTYTHTQDIMIHTPTHPHTHSAHLRFSTTSVAGWRGWRARVLPSPWMWCGPGLQYRCAAVRCGAVWCAGVALLWCAGAVLCSRCCAVLCCGLPLACFCCCWLAVLVQWCALFSYARHAGCVTVIYCYRYIFSPPRLARYVVLLLPRGCSCFY